MTIVSNPSIKCQAPPHFFGYARKLESIDYTVQYKQESFKLKEFLTALHPSGALARMKITWNTEQNPQYGSIGTAQFMGIMPGDTSGRWRNIHDEEDFWIFVLEHEEALLVPHTTKTKAPLTLKRKVCKCQKVKYTEEGARMALVQAKIKRYLHHNKKRREERHYECPGQPGIFHLTSLKVFHRKGEIVTAVLDG